MPFCGPAIPFGAMLEYHPISAKNQSRLHQFGAKVLPGIILGYALYAGRIWKGNIMVADIEDLEEMDASELHARRFNAKEVLTPQRSEHFILPVADGTVKNLWWRTVSENIHLNPGSYGTRRRTSNSTSRRLNARDDEEAKGDFWTITGEFNYRHHVEPRVKLYMTQEETFLFPVKYIDFTRTTYTSLDVLFEKILKTTGTWMEKKKCQMHGQDSQDLFH